MANTYMQETHAKMLNIRKMQVRSTMSYHLTPTRMARIKMKLEYFMLSEKKPVGNGRIPYDLLLKNI